MQKVCTDEDILKNQILKYNLQWFAKDGEGGEKTEPATAKKLKDAREEGKVVKSRELNSAFGLIVLFLCLKIFVSYVGQKLIAVFTYAYGQMADFVLINEKNLSTQAIASLFKNIILQWMLIVLPFFCIWGYYCIAGQYCSGGMESFHETYEAGTVKI